MSNALAVIDPTQYAIMESDPEEMIEVMRANLGDGNLSKFQLSRIRIPGAGGLQWELPSLDAQPEFTATFSAIIVNHRISRSYWERAFGDGDSKSPPDCSSPDGIQGYGRPGIKCAECALGRFDDRGNAPRCKKTHSLFLMLPDDLLPTMLQVPPTSLSVVQQYLLGMTQKGVPYYGVVTNFSLERAESRGGGQKFAKLKLSVGERLNATQRAKAREYSRAVESILSSAPVMAATGNDPLDADMEDLELA